MVTIMINPNITNSLPQEDHERLRLLAHGQGQVGYGSIIERALPVALPDVVIPIPPRPNRTLALRLRRVDWKRLAKKLHSAASYGILTSCLYTFLLGTLSDGHLMNTLPVVAGIIPGVLAGSIQWHYGERIAGKVRELVTPIRSWLCPHRENQTEDPMALSPAETTSEEEDTSSSSPSALSSSEESDASAISSSEESD